MSVQIAFENFITDLVRLLQTEDPRAVHRSKILPALEIDPKKEINLSSGPDLGVQISDDRIILPRIPEEILDPFLGKIAFDWLFHAYLQNLPEPAHQFSFLMPWFLLKTGKWQTPWEELWLDVFPAPFYHKGQEFSRDLLLRSYKDDDILLISDFMAIITSIIDDDLHPNVETIPPEMFLEEFFQQLFPLRKLNKTEQKILTCAITIRSTDPKKLKDTLKLPRSTTYKTISRCLRKLHLKAYDILKEYRLGLEPILLVFPNLPREDMTRIEEFFRNFPYFYNSGHFITPETKQTRNTRTLLINLRFPGSFTHELRNWVKKLVECYEIKFHYFRWDRFEHGYSLQNYDIDVQTYYTFDYRGGIGAKPMNLLPNDLKIIEYRLRRIGLSFHEIERIADIPTHIVFAAEKRLRSELITGQDITIGLKHIVPVRELRLTIKDPNPEEIIYFRRTFPEYYIYRDVNDRELHILLFVPKNQSQELTDWITNRSDRIQLWGYNLGLTWAHFFNYADLESEYDYDINRWRDPFRHKDW